MTRKVKDFAFACRVGIKHLCRMLLLFLSLSPTRYAFGHARDDADCTNGHAPNDARHDAWNDARNDDARNDAGNDDARHDDARDDGVITSESTTVLFPPNEAITITTILPPILGKVLKSCRSSCII